MADFYHVVKYPGRRWQVKRLSTDEYLRICQEAEVSSNGYAKRGIPDNIAKRRNDNGYQKDW